MKTIIPWMENITKLFKFSKDKQIFSCDNTFYMLVVVQPLSLFFNVSLESNFKWCWKVSDTYDFLR